MPLPDPDAFDLPMIRARWAQQRREMHAFLAGLTPDRLAEIVNYTSGSGQQLAQPLSHLMLHVVVHGAHHRSEVAEMLTRAGHPPPTTDLVVYLRREQTDPT